MAAQRNPTTRTLHFIGNTRGGFDSAGQTYTHEQVAAEIRDEPWAAIDRYGDVIAGPDRERVTRYGNPVPGDELAALLAGR